MVEATTGSPARTSTLTSLAVLKVNIDQRRDYLDYLRPFVLQVLTESHFPSITDYSVAQEIEKEFGLTVPQRTVQLVLRRLARAHSISRKSGEYHITGVLPSPKLSERRAEAQGHIDAILLALQEFSESSLHPIEHAQGAVDAVTAFLSRFDVSCLRAYLRGTAIPALSGSHPQSIVLVSDFVRTIQERDHRLFQSFVILVQGHMLANALLCPDLEHVTQDYRNVTFYFDTPLLVQRLGLEGRAKEEAARDLLELLSRLKAKLAVFEHSRDELRAVISAAGEYIDPTDGRGAIVVEARKNGTTRSDLVLLAESIESKLSEVGIETHRTPIYRPEFQIDETQFENVLDDYVEYRNPRAKLYDINSVRSIYALRAKGRAPTLERAKAALVTSNGSLATAAWEYGQQYESSQDVSSAITDFTLANAAWLKAPFGAPNIPTTRLLSFAYAALEPSDEVLDKYMAEIDRLEADGTLATRELELLRSSPSVYPELMGYTLGDPLGVNPQTITRTLRSVSSDIKAEETVKLHKEQESHRATQLELADQSRQHAELLKSLHWRCQRNATKWSWVISVGMAVAVSVLLVVGLLGEVRVVPFLESAGWILSIVSAVLMALAFLNIVLGFSVKGLHGEIQRRIFTFLLRKESKFLGVDLEGSAG